MPTLTALAKDERTARQLLAVIGSPGDISTGALLSRIGAVEAITLIERDTAVPGMDAVESAVWRDRMRPRAGVDYLAAQTLSSEDYRVLIPSDPDWPTGIADLGDRAPYALWARGRTNLLVNTLSRFVTVTGARAATAYGTHITEGLAGELARNGKTLVAGAAYGIEGSVHRAALAEGGNTIAVLASGIDRPYPAGHSELVASVTRAGLVLSEAPPNVAPTRQRFLDRSRILAAVSGATIVVEAGYRSGALHTAHEANALGRIVGAVPGPITSAASSGTNHLLQDGGAEVIVRASDVVRALDAEDAPSRNSVRPGASRSLSPASRAL